MGTKFGETPKSELAFTSLGVVLKRRHANVTTRKNVFSHGQLSERGSPPELYCMIPKAPTAQARKRLQSTHKTLL